METNQLATTQKQGITAFLSSEAVKNNIVQVVGQKNSTKFIASVVSAVQANPTLGECTNKSILSSALLGEALQLSPSPQLGQYYMVPYDNSKKVGNTWQKVKEAQFQIGYKGMIQLAIRSGQYRKITVTEIKDGEVVSYNSITEDAVFKPIMNQSDRANARTVGYYAMFELMNGFRKELYWPIEKMEEHAKAYSSGYRNDLNKGTKYTFWSKSFNEMAKKTMLRQLISKWGIMSIEMQKAYESDMAVIDDNGNQEYVDNQTVEETVESDIAENANKTEFIDADESDVKEVQ